ncbi:MAG: ATP-binding protein [Verrucomicrobiota bacterium]
MTVKSALAWLRSLGHQASEEVPERLRQSFVEEERQATLAASKLAAFIAVGLIMVAVVLDVFAYPELAQEFFILRCLGSAVLLIYTVCLRSPFLQAHYRATACVIPIIAIAMISLMIYRTGDPSSHYYAGITLALVAFGLMFPWLYRESNVILLLTFFIYGLANLVPLLGERTDASGLFLNNVIFIALNGVFIVVSGFALSRFRIREFVLRSEAIERQDELRESNAKLRELDRIKTDFLANVSHELRTPLTLVIGHLKRFRESIPARLPESQGNAVSLTLDTMQKQSLRLLKLINDLLDVSKAEAGGLSLKYKRFELRSFLSAILRSVSGTAQERRIELASEVEDAVPSILEADEEKIEKVLLNLIFNSIKFTGEQGSVTITVSLPSKDSIAFEVSDTGRGIDPEALRHIFDRFWQEDSSIQRTQAGTGIGLSLVKETVEAHHGHVSAESVLGRGTRVSFVLPAKAPEKAVFSAEVGEQGSHESWLGDLFREANREGTVIPSKRSSLRVPDHRLNPSETFTPTLDEQPAIQFEDKPRVLVADDEPEMRRLLAEELESEFEIVEAGDGTEALEAVALEDPEIILLDYMMPGMDGLTVARKLKSDPATEAIPILLLTARADEETRLNGLAAGISDVLIKPYSVTEMHIRVRHLIQGYRLQKEVRQANRDLESSLRQLRETESQLMQSEKLASLGQLSAGIIHEINNPVNFIGTATQVLRKKLNRLETEAVPGWEAIVNDIRDGLARISSIVQDLRSFSHPGDQPLSPLPLHGVVDSALRFLVKSIRDANADIQTSIPESIQVMGDQNRLIQVLLNLLQNALQATKLNQAPQIAILAEEVDAGVLLKVRDEGTGIPNDALSKLFDPFFTTKQVGEGMGLGLSICHRIMEDHGGTIQVKSQPGSFTEFQLFFPEASPSSNEFTLRQDLTV